MKLRAFGKCLTIEINVNVHFGADEIAERRKLAWRVDELAKSLPAHAHTDYYSEKFNVQISRIKAMRQLTGYGLSQSKNWVESAFLDNGAGKVA